MSTVSVPNMSLQTLMAALRVCGSTTVPMALAIRMLETQKSIVTHLQMVNEVNNSLVEKYGEALENGQYQVTPELKGWAQFQIEANALTLVEFDVGEPFILYHREGKFGWTKEVKTPVAITPNVMVDMGDLLVIEGLGDNQVAGHIEPTDEVE